MTDLTKKEEALAYIAAWEDKHPNKAGIVFVTSASAVQMNITVDTLWDGRVNGRPVTNPAFKKANETIDGNMVLICEDTRLGVHYSTAEGMNQLYDT